MKYPLKGDHATPKIFATIQHPVGKCAYRVFRLEREAVTRAGTLPNTLIVPLEPVSQQGEASEETDA